MMSSIISKKQRDKLEVGRGYELSEPTPSDLFPLAKPHLLNLYKHPKLRSNIQILGTSQGHFFLKVSETAQSI